MTNKSKPARYLKTGQIVYFLQIWEGEKPKIDCYSSKECNQDELVDALNQFPDVVGYGKLSIDRDDKVHLWSGKVDEEHLRTYIAKMKNRNLEIVVD